VETVIDNLVLMTPHVKGEEQTRAHLDLHNDLLKHLQETLHFLLLYLPFHKNYTLYVSSHSNRLSA
jgi:hypothetical protein